MGRSTSSSTLRPWVSNPTLARQILIYLHFTSPLFLLTLFLVAFTAYGIATASSNPEIQAGKAEHTSPRRDSLPRKTLPSTKRLRKEQAIDFSPTRKQLFAWLSVGIILTFLANATIVVLHAVIARKENWWCGESVVVNHLNPSKHSHPAES